MITIYEFLKAIQCYDTRHKLCMALGELKIGLRPLDPIPVTQLNQILNSVN